MRARACLVLLGGEIPDPLLVRRAARLCRGILCADGGLRHALGLRLQPDFVVGDMDSLPRPLPRLKKAVFCCDFDQDRSDFEKALGLAGELGCRRVYVAGALGGRTDHALINLALIERLSPSLEIVLLDSRTARLLGPGTYRFTLARGAIFSLLAVPRARVSLSGAKYKLAKAVLEPGSRGLSNQAKGPVRLRVHRGRVWFMSSGGRERSRSV